MDSVYDLLRISHVIGFVFMSVPLFNLIVVNERALLGSSFNYYADRYLENIIRHGATRCFAFQVTVLVTGVLGMQVQGRFDVTLNFALIALAALFAWRANRTLMRFGWV